MGLAIVRKIVEDHEGTIGVTSEPGKTVFRIELPQKKGQSGVHPAVGARSSSGSGANKEGSSASSSSASSTESPS